MLRNNIILFYGRYCIMQERLRIYVENLYVCISPCLWNKVEEYILYTQKHFLCISIVVW